MKTKYHNLLGKKISLNARDAAWHMMSAICESILCSEHGLPLDKNLFGRPLTSSSSNDISFSSGFASTGLRSGIILNAGHLSSNLENIAHAVRVHIPLVIFSSVNSQLQVSQLSQTGGLVFSANTCQEAVDLLLIGYRIAELSLIPVIVCIDEALCNTEETIFFPEKELLATFAGSPDILISSPTASQQIIFGKQRKRIPNWFNLDNPVSIGAEKQANESALETAAQQEFFYQHLQETIHDSFQAFHKASERNYHEVEAHHSKDAEYLLLSYGSISKEALNAVEKNNSGNKVKTAALRLIQISPFPEKAVRTHLERIKVVTVLEQAINGFLQTPVFKELSCLNELKHIKLFSGNYGSVPSTGSLLDVISNMYPGGKGKSKFWIDLEFSHTDSNYPKHQVLMQAIDREYPDVKNKTISSSSISKENLQNNNIIPQSIRKYKDQGPAYAKLSRFFDDTASFFLTHPEELVADPFQALPVMPPLTAYLPDGQTNSNAAERKLLPEFNSAKCSGCGDCFLHCPHSAINPLAIGMENFIKAGASISSANGIKITQLTPLIKNIAKNSHEIIKQNAGGIHSISDFLPAAFEKVALQMKLEGEKLQTAKQDMESVTAALKNLPLSITYTFYNNPDQVQPGSGELFTLAIDTTSCTGCSVCASVCQDDALEMRELSMDIISSHRENYAVWEQMPDTGAAIITRLLDDENYNSFSALLLSRHFNLALNGRSMDNEGDASKSMVHLITAIAEAAIQPKVKDTIKTIDELISGLSLNIQTQLGSAVPSQDIDALSKALSEIKEDKKPFEEVIEKIGMGEHLKLVDTKSLKRKVDLTKSLRTLSWLLSEGASGSGRSRMGLALDGSLKWTNSYPWNNFTSPVIIQVSGSSPELAKGIVQGQIRQVLDNIKILRRAELEINGTYEPGVNDIQIASLNWDDLTEKEKDLVPPIILIGNKSKLAGTELISLVSMLDCDWPLKAIVLDDASPQSDNAGAEIIGSVGSLLPALSLGKVHVLKSSLAAPKQLFNGLSQVFNSNAPALAWVFVPVPSKHMIPSESFPKLHALSLNSRAFTLFDFNPRHEGTLLSSKMELAGNPQSESIWMQSNLSFKEEGEEKTMPYSLTWADWAYTLKSWREHFILHNEVMGKATLISEFILLPESDRSGKAPVIFRIDQHEELKKYKVSDEVIEATEACVQAWQVLREISGELSEFPEKLQKKVEANLSEKYEKKLSEVKNELENKITNLEQAYLEKIRIKLKEKLVELSNQKA